MNETDVTKTHAATIDALNELAASLIRSGAPVDAVQKFVDAEIDRIEFMQGQNPMSESDDLLAAIERCGARAKIAQGNFDRFTLMPSDASSARTYRKLKEDRREAAEH